MKFIDKIKSALGSGRYALYKSVGLRNVNNYYSTAQLLRLNEISLYANRGIDKRAEKVGEIQFILRDEKGEIVERNEWTDLLNRPNKHQTGKQFWKLTQKYLDITGYAFIRKVYNDRSIFYSKDTLPSSLELLPTHKVEIIYNQDETEILGYKYHKAVGGTEEFVERKDEIIMLYEPSPINPLKGVSLLQSGIGAIDTELQLMTYHRVVLKNGGKPEGMFKFKSNLTSSQIKELEEQYKEKQAGAEKSGVPLFLQGDAEYINIGLKPSELSFLETKKVTFSDICILTGVPEPILSMRDVKYDNADMSEIIFSRTTIFPLMKSLTEILDWRLLPDEYDLDFVDPTPTNKKALLEQVKTAYDTSSATPNELRDILGMERYEDELADMLWVPFNKQPMKQETVKEEKQIKKKEFIHPLKDDSFRSQWSKLQVKRHDKRTVDFKKVIVKYFENQEKTVIEKLEATKHFRKKGIDDYLDWNLQIEIGKNTVLPLLREMMITAGVEYMDMLGTGTDFSITSAMENWITARSQLFAEEINETSRKRLEQVFIDVAEDGGRTDLVKGIKEVFGDFKKTRAETIARTETHGAIQKGAYEAQTQAGLPIKIWVWGIGVKGGIRDNHLAMDGEEQPMSTPFSNGLMYAGDMNGGADEVINCQCST